MISHYDFNVFLIQVTEYQHASLIHMCRSNYMLIVWLRFIIGSLDLRKCMLWAVCCWWCMWQVCLCAPFLSLKPANMAWILMTHRHSYLLGLVILLRLASVPPVAYTLRPFWDEPLESLDALHFVFRPQLILYLFPRGWCLKLSCPFGLR